jgi:hypothetical protein
MVGRDGGVRSCFHAQLLHEIQLRLSVAVETIDSHNGQYTVLLDVVDVMN